MDTDSHELHKQVAAWCSG